MTNPNNMLRIREIRDHLFHSSHYIVN